MLGGQGWQRAVYVQDVRYVAGAGQILVPYRICISHFHVGHGDEAVYVQDVRADFCSRQNLHFRHPWRSYVAGAGQIEFK